MTYALDTNIISYMLRYDANVCDRYRREMKNGNKCVIPPMVYYEIKRGLLAANATSKMRGFDDFCLVTKIGEMGIEVLDEAARIYAARRKAANQTIEDADLLIAAFCVVNGYSLVTNNTRHFEEIDGLQLENWTRV